MMKWSPLQINLFDCIYELILDLDNKIEDSPCSMLFRESLINSFLQIMNDVYEKGCSSNFFKDYYRSTSINSFFKYIIKPRFDEIKYHNESNRIYKHFGLKFVPFFHFG